MPIYEYICNSCQQIKEILQKFNEETPKECSYCKEKNSMHRTVSQTSFHLKGGGWYKDLYSSIPKKNDKLIKNKVSSVK